MGALDEEAISDASPTLVAAVPGADRAHDGSTPSPSSRARGGGSHGSGNANMGAFGSSASLASAGSTGSLGALSGSQGRNAGVYAASELGPFEPAFSSGPAYRDPSVDVAGDEPIAGDELSGDASGALSFEEFLSMMHLIEKAALPDLTDQEGEQRRLGWPEKE